jgi:hypothetical protein
MGDQRFIMWKKKGFYVNGKKENDLLFNLYIACRGVRTGNI